MEFVKAFNGFRGFAFINVLIDHYYWVNGCTLDIGQFGVAMFYVLSAYLLTMQLYKQYLEKKKMNILNYSIRRIFRIYPVLILALICEYYTGRLNSQQIKGIFFLTGAVGFYWAIYVEMRYYLVIPILVYLFAKIESLFKKYLLMLGLTFVFLFYHYYLNFLVDDPRGFRRWDIDDFSFAKNIVFINYLPIFAIGSFMAIIVYHLKKNEYNFSKYPFLKGLVILFISVIHAAAIYYRCLNKGETFWNLPFSNLNIIFCLGYVILLMYLNGDNFMTRFYEHPIVSFMGEISYPAYLFHTIIREFMFKYFEWEKKFQDLFSCFIFTIVLSYIIHISIENTFINYTKFWFSYSNTPNKDSYSKIELISKKKSGYNTIENASDDENNNNDNSPEQKV